MDNTVGNKEVKYPSLTKVQKDLLIGSILGDACLEPLKTGARAEITHCRKQQEYLEWKFQHLKKIVLTAPKLIKFKDKRINKNRLEWRFRTISHPEIVRLRKIFYKKDRKIIPENIEKILKSPFSLAVWYMDDGKKRPDCRGAYLDTICFTKNEQKRLIRCLEKNFRIKSRLHWNGDGYHIYIPIESIERFRSLIEKYIIPSMKYKLPYTRNDSLPKRQRMKDKPS